MICPYCNNDIPDNSTRCDICGVEFEIEKKAKKHHVNTPAENVLYWILKSFYSGIFVVFGIAVAIFTGKIATFFVPVAGFTIIGISLVLTGLSVLTSSEDDTKNKVSDIISKITGITYLIGFYFFVCGFLVWIDIGLFKDSGSGSPIPIFIVTLVIWAIVLLSAFNAIKDYVGKGKDK